MVKGIRTVYPRGLNKELGSKFCKGYLIWLEGSWVWQETPVEGWWVYWLKHCVYNNKDEDNSLNTLIFVLISNHWKFIFSFSKHNIQKFVKADIR